MFNAIVKCPSGKAITEPLDGLVVVCDGAILFNNFPYGQIQDFDFCLRDMPAATVGSSGRKICFPWHYGLACANTPQAFFGASRYRNLASRVMKSKSRLISHLRLHPDHDGSYEVWRAD
jgi:hypothetical protein